MKKDGFFKEWGKALIYGGLIAILFRSILFEPFNIPSGSMIPTLEVGDHILVQKWSYGYSRYSFPFGSWGLWDGRLFGNAPEIGDVVVFRNHQNESFDYVKRMVAVGGDTVQMKAGRLYINGQMLERETVGEYIVAVLDKDTKNVGFAKENIRIMGNDIWVDDIQLKDGYTIEYKDNNCGRACGLDTYCRAMCEGQFGVYRATLYMETLPNGVKHKIIEVSDSSPADNTPQITVPENHYFMLGDNRDNSADSRYIGPVPREYLLGRVWSVWYSHNYFSPMLMIWDWGNKMRWERFGQKVD